MRASVALRSRLSRGIALTALAACSATGEHGGGAPPHPARSAPLEVGSPPRAFDEAWERALEGDEAALDALARREGALGLLGALDDARFGATARRALPWAADAELALASLAARARAGGARALDDLSTLAAILASPSPFGERLAPEDDDATARDLLAVAGDAARPVEVRAKAVTALGRLAHLGRLDPARVPSGP